MNKNYLPTRSYRDRLHDEKLLAAIKKEHPEYIESETPQFDEETLAKIGIENYNPKLASGYIKLFERDFIVEEIDQANQILTIQPPQEASLLLPLVLPGRTVFLATLIKKGMSTVEAIERIAESLNIPLNCIKYAGIKDARAITAQRISISRINQNDLGKLQDLPNIIFKDWQLVTQPVDIGQLKGNLFTITVRGETKLDELNFRQTIDKISQKGFINFFSLQRFGSRLINAQLGKLIMQKRYEEAVKIYLTQTNQYESSYFQNARAKINENWESWKEIYKILEPFHYYLYYEKTVVRSLAERPGDYVYALGQIQSQSKIFVYAYFSYLFNKLLSRMIMNNQTLPEKLPLYRPRREIQDLYFKYLPEEAFAELDFAGQLPFLMLNKIYELPTYMAARIFQFRLQDNIAMIEFSLGKGAYATTFLQNIFNLRQGTPQPEWLDKVKIDAKKIMGRIPIEKTEKLFKSPREDETLSSED